MIEENHSRRVRMGHLAFLGSRRVNGVSALHHRLMRQTVFRDLNVIHPERIVSQDQRHFLPPLALPGNPGLTKLIVDAIGPEVEDDPTQLESLVTLADDASFRERFAPCAA
jgi:starch phosphorylase